MCVESTADSSLFDTLNLPLVIYTTTRIIMPTLLNINAVNCRQCSFARSANGGFGILWCRRRNDLNLCFSIFLLFNSENCFFSFVSSFSEFLYNIFDNFFIRFVFLFYFVLLSRCECRTNNLLFALPINFTKNLFKSANKVPHIWFAHNFHFNCVRMKFIVFSKRTMFYHNTFCEMFWFFLLAFIYSVIRTSNTNNIKKLEHIYLFNTWE